MKKQMIPVGAVALIFTSVYVIYGVPGEPVFYALALSGLFFLLWYGGGFLWQQRRLKQLRTMEKQTEWCQEQFPYPLTKEEKEYQKLLLISQDAVKRERSRAGKVQQDMTDYYTLWAHQIKVPISAARLLLQAGSDKTPLLLSEIFKIEQYVEMVLSYLRLESDSSDYLIKEYEVDGIMKQALRRYAPLFIQKKLSLSYEETGVKMVTDEKWLLFAVEQLLSNALKYTKEGCITVSVEEGCICIQDTGIGIAPEDLPRIGEKGFTGYNGRTDKKSTGLGLYLCTRILNNLGCSLEITSAVGEGTTARILQNCKKTE